MSANEPEMALRSTPLSDCHIELRARMVPFSGWNMPVQYTGILEESRAVRTSVGLFDISHMGRVHVSGSGALRTFQSLTSNNVEALIPGQAHYSLIPNTEGGIVDDIIVYRIAEEEFLVVFNAGNAAKDLDWFRSNAAPDTVIVDQSDDTAMIAVQGPNAVEMVARLAGDSFATLGRFHHTTGEINCASARFCRTGYTGEDGFELIIPAKSAADIWNALILAGGMPCGLGARDALRIEAGLPLYGHEIDDTTSPVEAGLMWVVKLEKGLFTGSTPIAELKERGPSRRLVGLVLAEKISPRQGYNLYANGEEIGQVTSGVFSPVRGIGLGMAYVKTAYSKSGTVIEMEVRGKRLSATVVPKKNLLTI